MEEQSKTQQETSDPASAASAPLADSSQAGKPNPASTTKTSSFSVPDSEGPATATNEEQKQQSSQAATTAASTKLEAASMASAKKSSPPVMVLPSSLQKLASTTNTAAAAAKPATNVGAKSYTFACGRGNYPNHIIAALKARGNWTQVAEEVAIDTCNFYWR